MNNLKKILLTVLLLSSLKIFSADIPIYFDHTFVGINTSAYLSQSSRFLTVDLVGYRVRESHSGLGLSVYALPITLSTKSLHFSITSLEMNWQFYESNTFLWAELYCRFENYVLFNEEFDIYGGIRAGFKIDGYKLLSIEAGFGHSRDFFIGLSFDPVYIFGLPLLWLNL